MPRAITARSESSAVPSLKPDVNSFFRSRDLAAASRQHGEGARRVKRSIHEGRVALYCEQSMERSSSQGSYGELASQQNTPFYNRACCVSRGVCSARAGRAAPWEIDEFGRRGAAGRCSSSSSSSPCRAAAAQLQQRDAKCRPAPHSVVDSVDLLLVASRERSRGCSNGRARAARPTSGSLSTSLILRASGRPHGTIG